MSRADFIICSLAFHSLLLMVAMLLPPPFPSTAGYTQTDLAFVELAPEPAQTDAEATTPFQTSTPAGMSQMAMLMPQIPGKLTINLNAGLPGLDGRPAGTVQPASVQQPAGRDSRPGTKAAADEQSQQSSDFKPALTSEPVGKDKASKTAYADESPVSVSTSSKGMVGLVTGRESINFRYQKGWPVPAMVRVDVSADSGGVNKAAAWTAKPDQEWIIVSAEPGNPGKGHIDVGVMAAKLGLGFYQGEVKLAPSDKDVRPASLSVTAMILPEDPGKPELRHFAWDAYMDGECKVCHLPEQVMPDKGFMLTPEFCGLCHSPNGIAATKLAGKGGHPVGVKAGAGGTRMPTAGTVETGPYSDAMRTHLPGGRVVCVTCHNVMYKPGDYGRTWELAASDDGRKYTLAKGGWSGMGSLRPRVYVTKGLTPAPRMYSGISRFLAEPTSYVYDERDGSITFDAPLKKEDTVYVTLVNPYLRVTTENDALCYDCHTENTHYGLKCMDCHAMHGTGNIKSVRAGVRMPGRKPARVVFTAYSGAGSFAAGGPKPDGICEVCHTSTKHHTRDGAGGPHKDGRDYTARDCTACHRHENGFGM